MTGASLWLSWVTGTAVGTLVGPLLGDPETLGLDAAFPALFVALLWPLLARPGAPRAAVAGAAVAFAVSPVVPAGVPLLAAAVVGWALSR